MAGALYHRMRDGANITMNNRAIYICDTFCSPHGLFQFDLNMAQTYK